MYKICGETVILNQNASAWLRMCIRNRRIIKWAAVIHWKLCEKCGFECKDKYYENTIIKYKNILVNSKAKILRYISIQTMTSLGYNKSERALLHKQTKIFSTWKKSVYLILEMKIKKRGKSKTAMEFWNF